MNQEEGFRVVQIKDIPEIILNHRGDSNLILYYPTGDNDHIKLVSSLLTEMCHDDNKTLCLAGDPLDIDVARDINNSDFITNVYTNGSRIYTTSRLSVREKALLRISNTNVRI